MKLSPMALALAAAPLLAVADNHLDDIPPLVVTRATPAQQVAPASIKVITRKQIESSGSQTLVDVLRGQAVLQVRDTLGDGNRVGISLRGFGENAVNNTLVLVDGRRLNNPSLEGPNLNSVPLANIERIEVLRGAGTVLYGDQAVGGVVNIITRQPSFNEAYIESSIGSHDLEAYRGHIHQQLGGGFSTYLSGETRNTDNYRDHNNASYDDAFARLRYDHDNGHALYEYQSTDDELELPGYLTVAERRNDRKASYASNSNGWSDSKTQTHRFAVQQKLSDAIFANFDYSHRDSDGKGAYNSAFGTSPFNQGTRVETFSPRLSGQIDTPLGASEWLLGHDHVTSDYEYYSSFGDTKFRQTQRDWYGQWIQPLSQSVSLTAGYRSSEAEDRNHSQNNRHTDSQDSTSLGLNWAISQQLRAFIKREDVLRWANVDENAFKDPSIDFLKPQTGESWESGIEWQDNIQRYQATLYRLDLNDELMYDPLATGPYGPTGANINLDQTRRDGLLLEADYRLTHDLSIGGQYSFTDSEFRSGNYQGNEVPWVSRHSASAHLTYQILPGLKGYVESVYTGGRYVNADLGNTLGKEGGYTLFNAALTYEYEKFISKLRVNNLTGKRYDSFSTYAPWVAGSKGLYPGVEEDVQLSLGYRF
ncbi:TonB-dependent receptor family protein [Atopomonas sediminilitoris]|uniref:TonB-dependent receptor family protein n=1 Tax=Atopomonas sediminilitoris TaxID=2919919 RepID=UPI001F4D68AF|nr:TonB-dependent receptor [Atopomonas sediminilitoris]MCJ8170187.1 TonB-dependent receptor [Atopomonas sediminilitoris]